MKKPETAKKRLSDSEARARFDEIAREKRTRLVVLEAPETSPWARIRALEARIVEDEKRNEEAIARLSLAVDLLLHAPETGMQRIEDQVTKAHMRVNELMGEAWDRVFEEWQRDSGSMTEEDLEREHQCRSRERSTLKTAGTGKEAMS